MDSRLKEIFAILFRSVIQFLCSIEQFYFRVIDDNLQSILHFLNENPYINKHDFFKRSNDIRTIDMVHRYDYPLNGGRCWNCGRNYTHECCSGCKRDRKVCDCVYICGFMYPTEQRNQFAKCRFFTNNMNDIVHECRGRMRRGELVLYVDKQNTKYFTPFNIERDLNDESIDGKDYWDIDGENYWGV
ncbi:hypothetical protein C2G38_2046650 [Gigaspora rosea]|uniref:Uncharacterized protein n=1 Tax=Gigaspora rosea TaxID=44941 RepID=A0A397U8M8_9GLOM|nr:hypothetical protein C2G38_2046650 [Gigaspora rosea]